ncbi:PTS sugar transporter subunit IIB [Olsenella sp. AM04-33]|jgi:mannose/fructose/N-acetylgalactosamine-specific phosphotransferase system component IIB|uniref:PTS sugar transporter subunit IIB n=1 Tax=Atopobiaceae TaxID=1643824 RepID=UPI000509D1CD|nr:PTS sugar transporter subunit IIB [Olsenella sp. AM04-33]RHK02015.1 PTS mannose/fructose/sorbose transporter subunit IIB [Olsenella sp. AM04-33]
MNIVATRVDERLIHGQVMASWSKRLQLARIVVVDNQIAKDDFMKTVLSMSAPAGMQIDILSVKGAANTVKSDADSANTMLLFKRISAALELARELQGSSSKMAELNLGNLGSVPGRVQVTKNIFLSEEERTQIRELQDLGVNVFLQMLYTDPKVPVDDVL